MLMLPHRRYDIVIHDFFAIDYVAADFSPPDFDYLRRLRYF